MPTGKSLIGRIIRFGVIGGTQTSISFERGTKKVHVFEGEPVRFDEIAGSSPGADWGQDPEVAYQESRMRTSRRSQSTVNAVATRPFFARPAEFRGCSLFC